MSGGTLVAATQALVIVGGTATGMLAASVSESAPSTPGDWVWTLGPFTASLGVAYWLLNRADNRERDAATDARTSVTELRDLLETANADRLVMATELASTKAELVAVHELLELLRLQLDG